MRTFGCPHLVRGEINHVERQPYLPAGSLAWRW
jgi:hypothetical protein